MASESDSLTFSEKPDFLYKIRFLYGVSEKPDFLDKTGFFYGFSEKPDFLEKSGFLQWLKEVLKSLADLPDTRPAPVPAYESPATL